MKRKYILLVMILTAALSGLAACSDKNLGNESNGSENAEGGDKHQTQGEEDMIIFPYALDDGKLTVNSLFQSSMGNPDCNGESGENIATLEVVNGSDEYLSSAKITVKLADGAKIPFLLTNIPAGRTVWAFATDNTSIELDFNCREIVCESQYQDEMPVMAEKISFSVSETEVTLHNLTGERLTGLSVGCHCLFDDVYFGGLTYSYQADELPANSSTMVNADDCYLGSAEVVCITQN